MDKLSYCRDVVASWRVRLRQSSDIMTDVDELLANVVMLLTSPIINPEAAELMQLRFGELQGSGGGHSLFRFSCHRNAVAALAEIARPAAASAGDILVGPAQGGASVHALRIAIDSGQILSRQGLPREGR